MVLQTTPEGASHSWSSYICIVIAVKGFAEGVPFCNSHK